MVRNSDYTITIEPSLTWLNSSERVYPVTVDPTFTVTPSTGSSNVSVVNGGVYYIRNKNYGTYLDVDNGSTANYTAVLGYSLHADTNQQWKITQQSDGYYTFTPMHNTAAAMAYNGTSNSSTVVTGNNITSSSSSYYNYTRWSIVSNGDGTVRIVAKLSNNSTSKVLDLSGGSGTQLQIYDWTGSGNSNQKWFLEKATTTGAVDEYRQVNGKSTNCFGYALRVTEFISLSTIEHTDDFEKVTNKVEAYIESRGRACRQIEGTGAMLHLNEYIIAMRVAYDDNDLFLDYHFMELTTDGWAHKQGQTNSVLLGNINPSTYSWDSGNSENYYNSETVYFAVMV